MNKTNFLKLVVVIMAFINSTTWLYAQNSTISGNVVDDGNLPLPGVSIMFKGTTLGTTSDADGKFILANPQNHNTLIFSFIGMMDKEVDIAGKSEVEVKMETGAFGLQEIVAIGYGVQKKRDLIGSVASVKSKDLVSVVSSRPDQMLQGKASGVQITTSSSHPGGNVSIRVRGTSSLQGDSEPLVIVDGVIGVNFEYINPNDIESMEVLKDASSTAIYGSRGANGVIIITTKRGKSGKTRVEYSGYTGWQTIRNKYDLINANEHAQLINNSIDNGIIDDTFRQPTNLGEGTDWQDEIFRTAAITNHNLMISGGNEKTTYSLSLDHFDQDGIVKQSNYTRNAVRLNLDQKVNDRFKIGANLYYTRSKQNLIKMNSFGGTGGGSVTTAALRYSPITSVYDGEDFSRPLNPASQTKNPMGIIAKTDENVIKDYIQGSFFGNYEIIDGLTLMSRLSFKINKYERRFFRGNIFEGDNSTEANVRNNSSENWLSETTLNYAKTINDVHDFSVLGGFTYEESSYFSSSMKGVEFPTETNKYNQIELGNPERNEINSDNTDRNIVSTIGRINYTYAGKYLFTASGRYDGSSVFGENNKFAFFPSFALGWRVSEEEFFNVHQISNLKLRASWGEVGNQAIPPYRTFASSKVESANSSYSYNGTTPSTSVRQERLPNPNLTWETTRQINVGMDLQLFKGRLSIVADYYKKNTRDLLFERPLPYISGQSSIIDNIGEVENRGYELQISTQNFTGDFKWNTDFNFSFNKTKVIDLGDRTEISLNPNFTAVRDGAVKLIEGETIGTFWGYEFDGVYQNDVECAALPFNGTTMNPGDAKMKDLNGDNKITVEDQKVIGRPVPEFIFGLNNTFEYKGFDLNIFISGVFGNDIMNVTKTEVESGNPLGVKTKDYYNNYWRGEGTSNSHIAPEGKSPISTYLIEDGSFVRVKNISLGYTLPSNLVKKMGIERTRFYVSGQNLLTLTDYSGFDPEVNSKGGLDASSNGNLLQGLDFGSYPTSRTFIVGVKVVF